MVTAPAATDARPAKGSRLARLTREERRSLGGMAAFVALLHVVGWGLLVLVVAPAEYRVAGQLFGVGLGVTAYTLSLIHI